MSPEHDLARYRRPPRIIATHTPPLALPMACRPAPVLAATATHLLMTGRHRHHLLSPPAHRYQCLDVRRDRRELRRPPAASPAVSRCLDERVGLRRDTWRRGLVYGGRSASMRGLAVYGGTRGTRRPSALSRRPSEAIGGHRRPSAVIEAIGGHPAVIEVIGGHPAVIEVVGRPSAVIAVGRQAWRSSRSDA